MQRGTNMGRNKVGSAEQAAMTQGIPGPESVARRDGDEGPAWVSTEANEGRADHGAAIVAEYFDPEDEASITDAIADLLHYAARDHKMSPDEIEKVIRRAVSHFEFERTGAED